MARAALALLVFSLFASGCGGSSGSDGGTGGSGGTAGSAGAGGSAGAACDTFADVPTTQGVTLTLSNHRSSVVFVTTAQDCGPFRPITLSDAQGADVPLWPGGCGYTCQDLWTAGGACGAMCAAPSVVLIEPNGKFVFAWSGATYESENMPAACYAEPSMAPATCRRKVEPSPGSYTFHARAETVCPTCVCTPDASGSCIDHSGPSVSGEVLVASASATLPATGAIELVFQ